MKSYPQFPTLTKRQVEENFYFNTPHFNYVAINQSYIIYANRCFISILDTPFYLSDLSNSLTEDFIFLEIKDINLLFKESQKNNPSLFIDRITINNKTILIANNDSNYYSNLVRFYNSTVFSVFNIPYWTKDNFKNDCIKYIKENDSNTPNYFDNFIEYNVLKCFGNGTMRIDHFINLYKISLHFQTKKTLDCVGVSMLMGVKL